MCKTFCVYFLVFYSKFKILIICIHHSSIKVDTLDKINFFSGKV